MVSGLSGMVIPGEIQLALKSEALCGAYGYAVALLGVVIVNHSVSGNVNWKAQERSHFFSMLVIESKEA